MSRILVTGGAGFIGSNLVDFLISKNHEVIVIDNLSTGRKENISHIIDKIEFINQDISQKGDWLKNIKGIEYVIHLAALADIVPSIENPQKYYESNVTGTINILELAKNNNIKKIIYSASSSCYGLPDSFPTKETAEIRPQYPYALTKYLGEQLLMHWSLVYKLPSISLRFFNVYGTRSRTSGTYGAVFGVFLAQKLAQKPFTVVGDGNQTRDFTYVTDVIEAIYAAIFSSVKNEIFNIGSDNTYKINEIVDHLNGPVINIPKRPGEPDCTWANIEKAKNLLGWKPKLNLKKGVEILLENIDYWKDAPVWDKDTIDVATKSWFKYLGNEKENS
tara:strand:+ start:9012 stop:10010 length:999 start_codon:yes stop_codon:yes gene_type:complete